MASPCVTDTNSIDLAEDGTGHLTATVRRDPAGAISETANGLKLALATASGLEIASDQLRVDVQGGGIARTANGLMKINQRLSTGNYAGAGLISVTQNVGRGATSDIATQISLNINNAGDTATYFIIHSTWGVDYTTTTPVETTATFDSVFVQLARSLNGAAFQNIDYDGLTLAAMGKRVFLKQTEFIQIAAGDTISYAVKPTKTGGTVSGTATQGHVTGHFGGSIFVCW